MCFMNCVYVFIFILKEESRKYKFIIRKDKFCRT
jgi:hypothetical protein